MPFTKKTGNPKGVSKSKGPARMFLVNDLWTPTVKPGHSRKITKISSTYIKYIEPARRGHQEVTQARKSFEHWVVANKAVKTRPDQSSKASVEQVLDPDLLL